MTRRIVELPPSHTRYLLSHLIPPHPQSPSTHTVQRTSPAASGARISCPRRVAATQLPAAHNKLPQVQSLRVLQSPLTHCRAHNPAASGAQNQLPLGRSNPLPRALKSAAIRALLPLRLQRSIISCHGRSLRGSVSPNRHTDHRISPAPPVYDQAHCQAATATLQCLLRLLWNLLCPRRRILQLPRALQPAAHSALPPLGLQRRVLTSHRCVLCVSFSRTRHTCERLIPLSHAHDQAHYRAAPVTHSVPTKPPHPATPSVPFHSPWVHS